MKLVLAEKPSVAQSIAKVLGAAKREDGYLEGNGYVVSWCVGHLVELAQPEVYDAKYSKWAYADLPIFPMDWQYEVSAGTKKQFGIVVGAGDTEYDALYDLLACRFIIPIGAAWPLRVLLFLKLTFLEGISWKITRRLFHVDARSVCEKKVIRLARQTSLSCAEIIKCIEMGIRRLKDGYDVLDKLYDDNDLNCDNFAQAVREYHCSREVITAVVNLYLRQQIMIDTY